MTLPRDAQGYYHYTSDTGRNAVTLSRVSHDEEYLYFEASCQSDITPVGCANWMRLLIRTRQDGPTWEGFHYIVNRNSPSDSAALERSQGGWKWSIAEKCEYAVDKNRILISVSRRVLGADTPSFRIWFKWCDNNLQDGDIMTLYTDGDASPGGRFMFSYSGQD